MIRGLFARLTADPRRGQALFDRLVTTAREPHWYVDGEVPDTVDGRFAMLATVTALATVRLEQGSERARQAAVALTERFIEAMDAEHRQMGVGDPAVGKTVRRLLGSLARRVELWRGASRDEWTDTARASVYGQAAGDRALVHTADRLRQLRERFAAASDAVMIDGRFG